MKPATYWIRFQTTFLGLNQTFWFLTVDIFAEKIIDRISKE